ncbi:2-oxoacid:acceptor oxidoreductase family protein [Anaeromyxobacter oryzae]|uniref:2-oxoacid:acceptor oxidoreductase family protein n=1 Tax=Anaeromyxobacter oryzae TaxID=2918170 RepID=UPI0020BDF833|nr:2-oxoacid:acceptor oxidoreductase family protein [Anaeromyxobacter oryzae]
MSERRASVRGLTEVRLHGRGGQGTVVASLMLARAAMLEGRSVQAFPEFGVERRGAPVTAFLRIASEPIHLRCRVERPDHVLVLDPALLDRVELPPPSGGVLVANTPLAPSAVAVPGGWRIASLDATRIARARRLGSGAMPIVNSPMAGAFARATGLVGLDALLAAIREAVPTAPDENVAAAAEAFERVAGDLPGEPT